ncbi:unnamed protein product [Urochloa humidicola]
MSGKALLVAVLLVGVASRCSGSRGLQGDHVAEQKYGGGGYGGGGGGYGGGGGGGGYGGGGGGGYTPGYSGTGTCDYWKSHPDAIVSCIGSLGGSILGSLGDVCSAFFGSKLQTLQDALCNTRSDCYGDLLREGAAAYLNSVASAKYAYTTQQVKDCIAVALTSEAAAAAQAAMFKKANYACHY